MNKKAPLAEEPGAPTGQFENHLLERFRKIYELKAVIPVQMLQPAILPKKLKVA